jgi:hypothetical protein
MMCLHFKANFYSFAAHFAHVNDFRNQEHTNQAIDSNVRRDLVGKRKAKADVSYFVYAADRDDYAIVWSALIQNYTSLL